MVSVPSTDDIDAAAGPAASSPAPPAPSQAIIVKGGTAESAATGVFDPTGTKEWEEALKVSSKTRASLEAANDGADPSSSLTRRKTCPPSILSDPFAKLRVLVVDDVPSNVRLISRALARGNHEIATEDNGTGAVQRIVGNGEEFDVCLMDENMPKMTGSEAVELIRKCVDGWWWRHSACIAPTLSWPLAV